MKLFYCLFLMTGLVVGETEVKYEDGVMVLTTENFDTLVAENKYVLVEFYTDWCMHCVTLSDTWITIAKQLKDENSVIKVAKVNGGNEKELNKRLKVTGYPTIILLKKQRVWEYDGKNVFKMGVERRRSRGRSATEILTWLMKKTGPACQPIPTKNDLDRLIDNVGVVVVGYFSNAESEDAKTYHTIADTIDDVSFGQVSDALLAEGLTIPDNGIVIFRKEDGKEKYNGKLNDTKALKEWLLDNTWVLMQELNEEFEGPLVYEGVVEEEELSKFVIGNRFPLISEYTLKSASRIFEGAVEMHNILFVKKSESSFQKLVDDFKKAAGEFKRKVLFIYVDTENKENERVMEYFGITAKECPDYRIVKMNEDMAKFKSPKKDLSTEAVIDFTKKVIAGQVQRHLKTEEIPEDWNKDSVHILVGKNFRDVAFDAKKKVFVQFYTPWCKRCKELAPIWAKLGEHYKDSDEIVIAKMDSSNNEVGEVQVSSFPSIKYFPDEDLNNMIDYKGEQSLDALIKFIDSNGIEVVGKEPEEPQFDLPDLDMFQEDKEVISVGDEDGENAKDILDMEKAKAEKNASTSEPAAHSEPKVEPQPTDKGSKSPKEGEGAKEPTPIVETPKPIVETEDKPKETTTEKDEAPTQKTNAKPKEASEATAKQEDVKVSESKSEPEKKTEGSVPVAEKDATKEETETEEQRIYKKYEEKLAALHDTSEMMAEMKKILPDPNPTGIPGFSMKEAMKKIKDHEEL